MTDRGFVLGHCGCAAVIAAPVICSNYGCDRNEHPIQVGKFSVI
jgi:hypothetical protein